MRDICFSLDEQGQSFCFIKEFDNAMPEIVRSAITLLFFSNITSMRVFNGSGIYGMLTEITTGASGYLQSNLSILSTELRRIMLQLYPELVNLDLTYELDGSSLIININITTSTDTFTETIYKQTL